MLAGGIAPKRIAAVTFTELAASELLIRIREFVSELSAGHIPMELRIALSDGISRSQSENLSAVSATIDELTCTTIHGFCQRLIKPYPVEADIDPGATVMDRDQADLAFDEVVNAWLVEELDHDADSLLAEMVMQDTDRTLALVNGIVGQLRYIRTVASDPSVDTGHLAKHFGQAVDEFAAFMKDAKAEEADSIEIARQFADLSGTVREVKPADSPKDFCRLLLLRPGPMLCTQKGSFKAYKKKGKWLAAGQAGRARRGRWRQI